MAKTFYAYQDRRGANQVDWNSLATDASNSLQEIQAGREQQRKELDDINQSLLTAANDVEMGNNQTFNQFVLDGSAQTKEFLLMQNRLLKKGLLNPNDYSRSMQTVKDDWASFSASSKKLNETYDDAMKRLADGTMAGEEEFKKEMLLKFANVQGKGIFVNPVDGRLYLAEKDKNGKLITDPDKLVNVAALNDMMDEKIPKLNVQESVSQGATKMADIIRVLRKNNVLTLKDARQNQMYKKAKEDFISSILANPKNQSSILADYLGGYEFTYDKKKAGGNVIYLERDGGGIGQPKLTKEQEATAREALDAAFETQIESIETAMPVFAPQRPVGGGSGKDDQEMMFAYETALQIASGTQNAEGLVQSIVRNPNSPISNVVARPNGITIEFKDGRPTEVIQRLDEAGNPINVDQVARAIFSYLDPRATPAKVADVAGKFRQKYGLPEITTPGNFGNIPYKGIDEITTAAEVGGQLASVPVRTAIMNMDPEASDAALQIDILAKKVNPKIAISPSSKDDYVDISFPGAKTQSFPLKSKESLSRISNYLEQLNQFIYKKQNEPVPTSAGSKPKAY